MPEITKPYCDLLPPREILDILHQAEAAGVDLPDSVEKWWASQTEIDQGATEEVFPIMTLQALKEELIAFLDSVRNYMVESGNNIRFDDRESEEFVKVYLTGRLVKQSMKDQTLGWIMEDLKTMDSETIGKVYRYLREKVSGQKIHLELHKEFDGSNSAGGKENEVSYE